MSKAFEEALSVQNASRATGALPASTLAAQQAPEPQLHPLHAYLTEAAMADPQDDYLSYNEHGINRTVYNSAERNKGIFDNLKAFDERGFDFSKARLADTITSDDNTNMWMPNAHGIEEQIPLRPAQALKIAFVLADFKTWQYSRPAGTFRDYIYSTALLSHGVNVWRDAYRQHQMQHAGNTTQQQK